MQNLGEESKATHYFLKKNVKGHFILKFQYTVSREIHLEIQTLTELCLNCALCPIFERILDPLPGETDKLSCASRSPCQSLGASTDTSTELASPGGFFQKSRLLW